MLSFPRFPPTDPMVPPTLMDRVAPDSSLHAVRRRTVPREQDRTLSSQARQWLRRLPTRQRPLALCSTYPRLANRLAEVWEDPLQTEAVFDDLMIDRRGGRMGFAPLIAGELMRLHRWHERRLDPGDNA